MYAFVSSLVRILKKIIPEPVVQIFRPFYHRALAFVMALSYGFPARRLTVIGITGTKGKSTIAEMVFAILREAGHKTALLSTIRFAIENQSEPNLHKMTLPGRGFAQAFMWRAMEAGCTHLVIELTSESMLQYRTLHLSLDGLIVTNIQREHIERHGSFANYVAAKRAIVTTLERSSKPARVLVTNRDIPETAAFLSAKVPTVIGFGAHELKKLSVSDHEVTFEYKNICFSLPLPGAFNATNALAAIKLCKALGISLATAARALAALPKVSGRVERIEAGQDFIAVVDYAHTPDSLAALYGAFPDKRKICVLGNTGGGRDTWKRPEMGRIADEACETVILTNEDPYDEDPRAIVEEMATGMQRAPQIIMDRRFAIRRALQIALSLSKGAAPLDSARGSQNQNEVAVLISGKGTDPYIMGAKGLKEPWSDARVVREELGRLMGKL